MLETIVADYIRHNLTEDDKYLCRILLNNTEKYANKLCINLDDLLHALPYSSTEELKQSLRRLSGAVHYKYGLHKKRSQGFLVLLSWSCIDFNKRILLYGFSSKFKLMLHDYQIANSLQYTPPIPQFQLTHQTLKFLYKLHCLDSLAT